MAAAMVQEQERAVGRWHAEWGPLTEIVGLTGGRHQTVQRTLFSFGGGFGSDAGESRTGLMGLVYAEEVAVVLAKQMGETGGRSTRKAGLSES